jgi:hypothetical protein
MRRFLRQLLLIARTTALEGLQQPVFLLLTLTSVTLTAFGPLLQLHAFGEEGRMARDSGLAFMLVFGLFVVGFTSGFTLADELRRGTAATTLAKPVHRIIFLVGKWCGVVAVLAVFCASATLATLLAERTAEHAVETRTFLGSIIDRYSGLGALAAVAVALLAGAVLNFVRGVRFGLATVLSLIAGQTLVLLLCGFIARTGELLPAYDLQVNLRLLPAATLVFLLLVLYAALATALSTRLKTIATLAVCALFLFVGFLADSLLGQASGPFARVAYALIPDVQHFWLADALANQGRIPLRYLAHAVLYVAAAAALLLGIGYAAFRSRDVA